MLNMLSPFYNLVADQLSSYFKKEAKQNLVNRYYLALPKDTHVQNIIEALKTLREVQPFTCEIEKYDTYESIALTYGEQKYVIASTLDNTHIDFLVTLRNLMSEQKGPWKNASLVIITENMLDSIQGGSKDLTSEGMPLHVSQIVKDLGKLIEGSNLTKSNIELLKHYLSQREDLQIVHKTSFIDFEDILSWAFKDSITKEDYDALGYFKDSELEQLIEERDQHVPNSSKFNKVQKEINQRLDLNADIFEEVARLRELGNGEERLVNMYDDCGKDLFKDEKEIELKQIMKAQEKVSERKEIVFKADQITIERVSDGAKVKTFWQKNSKGRTYDLIVFQPDYTAGDTLEIRLPFSRNTSDSYVTKNKDKLVTSKGHSLIVKLPLEENNRTYKSVAYRHENLTSSLFTFRILVIKEDEAWLKPHELTYTISATGDLKVKMEKEIVVFGDASEEQVVEANNQEVHATGDGLKLSFIPGLLDDDVNSLKFHVTHNDCTIGIEISDEVLRSIPIDAENIWNKKMKAQESFYFNEDEKKVSIGQYPYVTYERDRKFFKIEKAWLQEHLYYAKYEMNTLTGLDLAVPAKVLQAYDAFLNVLKSKNTIPSFVFYDEEVREAAEKYIMAFIQVIEGIKENEIMSNEERQVLYLGALEMGDTLYMTPFSPMNVAYQLEITKEVAGQIIDSNTLKRLKASYMLPYLVDQSDQILKSDSLNSLVEWHSYKPQTQVSVGETNNYLAQVIREKITQFISYYEYLFTLTSKPKMLINVINISNDKELLRGILQWYKDAINQSGSLEDLLTVSVRSYTAEEHLVSAFEQFNEINDPELVKELFNFDCTTKLYDAIDVLQQIQKHLSFSKLSIENKPEYSHLTFYKMQNSESNSKQVVQQAPNSLGLNGLYISTTSKRTENGGYRIGFGVGDSNANRSLLTKFAKLINELSANRRNGGNDPYMKEIAYSLHINEDDECYLNDLYQCTTWLTFIDPAVDLEYFQDASSDLVIVHYSDQLSSSNRYDAITVTNKSQQYYKVIDEFLRAQGVEVREESIEHIIKSFNTFNGEWLLRAVQNRAHDKREKMSIVAAIKHSLKIFDKAAIQWVPVSMEEIVRVAGNIRLNKKDGLFSGKTIGRKGNCSDDLMLIGIERGDNRLKMYLYPIEVKIGHNSQEVIQKGISQVIELKKRLKEHLQVEDSFDAKFLRNFFAKMFIINANKMEQNQFWPERSFKIDNGTEEALLNDEFDISDDLLVEFGIGSIISFKKQLQQPSNTRYKDVLVHEIPEEVAYQSIGISMKNLMENNFEEIKIIPIIERITEDNVEKLPEFINQTLESPEQEVKAGNVKTEQAPDSERQKDEKADDAREAQETNEGVSEDETKEEIGEPDTNPNLDSAGEVGPAENELEKKSDEIIDLESTSNKSLEKGEIRPLLGLSNGTPIYWEYGSTILSNRHLVIGGRSGSGKTYFIQSVLKQLVEMGQSSLIIDFSSSYTQNQLDDKFLNVLGNRLEERIVYYEGFPINPFARREKRIAGKVFEEKVSDTAARIQNVFTSVYQNFGPQQSSAIYNAAKECIELYGEKATMAKLLEQLKANSEIPTSVASSIINKLSLFVDIDPFDYDNKFSWDDYFTAEGKVFVIQFEGYDQDEVKKLMTEFILWDLIYYAQSGNDKKILPIILDEAQNLDFGSNSPSEKILREGRKFGISAWFATQTFSNFSVAERTVLENAATSIFFKPAESELNLVGKKMNIDNYDVLRSLQKGECIVQGQFLDKGTGMLSETKTVKIKVPLME